MTAKTLAISAILLSTTLAVPAIGEVAAPTGRVEKLHAALIDVMKDADTLGYKGRYDRLAPVIDETFDLDFMGSKAAGRHWRDLGEEEQKRWLEAFERFTVANYAGRFDGYSGQAFETLGDEPASHETVVVRTKLLSPKQDDVQLNYRLRETDDGWRIIDVYLNGSVSELALRRAEYGAALERSGLDTVLQSLESKIDDLSASAAQ